MSHRVLIPKSTALIRSLRGIGYSTSTALADIIDNSIAAKATEVRIHFRWDGDRSSIHILDNGAGMNDSRLETAMQIGGIDPTESRDAGDLGRFGLGLKTASFSQCKILTVASKTNKGGLSCLRWDLDYLASSANGQWVLLEGMDPRYEIKDVSGMIGQQGTLVIWNLLDRIVTDNFSQNDFMNLIDEVRLHLSMTFHRLIDRSGTLGIFINDQKVTPWDPFLVSKGSHELPKVPLVTSYGLVHAQGYILPSKRMLSEDEYKQAGGPNGWTVQQGFYVYRNKRLLVPGSWLGLGFGRRWTKDEAHRMARIRIDLTNSADHAWKIDVKKSTASPPISEILQLSSIGGDVRRRAREAFFDRTGQGPITKQDYVHAWKAESTASGIRYRINLDHPSIQSFFYAAPEHKSKLTAMIKVIEATVPIEKIWVDGSGRDEVPDEDPGSEVDPDVIESLKVFYESFRTIYGLSPDEAKCRLIQTEPFHKYRNIIQSLTD
jgi:hypothetical protein